jgi:cell division GTPase FtsZ
VLAVIGLGQAGSNISEEVGKYGILNGAINYSQKDLDAVEVKHKLRLLGSEGVGKQRFDAISLFQHQWETAINFIRDNFSNSKVIAFAFSSSGGSGSGISPILLDMAIQMFPDKVFISLVVIPEIKEAESSQVNCVSTFEELSALDVAVFPVDNQQIRNQNPTVGKNRLYEISNQEAASLICKLAEYTSKHSKNGNFDEKDLLTVLRTRGLATISETQLSSSLQSINLTSEGVADKVIQSWDNSVFAPLSSDSVQKAAVIFDGSESLMDFIRVETLFESFQNQPVDIFEGYYHEGKGKILTVLTGLKWSFKRLDDIEKSLINKQNHDESGISSDIGYKVDSSIIRASAKKQEKKVSVMDILSKYNR